MICFINEKLYLHENNNKHEKGSLSDYRSQAQPGGESKHPAVLSSRLVEIFPHLAEQFSPSRPKTITSCLWELGLNRSFFCFPNC